MTEDRLCFAEGPESPALTLLVPPELPRRSPGRPSSSSVRPRRPWRRAWPSGCGGSPERRFLSITAMAKGWRDRRWRRLADTVRLACSMRRATPISPRMSISRAFAAAARAAGAEVRGPVAQGDFLKALGAELRLGALPAPCRARTARRARNRPQALDRSRRDGHLVQGAGRDLAGSAGAGRICGWRFSMITLDVFGDGGGAVRHAFFTREGGVSEGLFASLNCGFGSGDDPAKVARNRAIAVARLGLAEDRLVTCYQVHSATVLTVDTPWRREDSPRADGMATARPGIALGVLAADCAPVLFADPEAGVIGAAHGGWRGALDRGDGGDRRGDDRARRARRAHPRRDRAVHRPAIPTRSAPNFRGRFAEVDGNSAGFFVPAARAGHFRFDLPGYIAHRLARLGLAAVEQRRLRHGRRPDAVLQLSARLPHRRARLRSRPRRDKPWRLKLTHAVPDPLRRRLPARARSSPARWYDRANRRTVGRRALACWLLGALVGGCQPLPHPVRR